MEKPSPARRRFRPRRWLLLYLALLPPSWLAASLRAAPEPRSSADASAGVPEQTADGPRERSVRLAYRDVPGAEGATPLLLLHGSPGSSSDFDGLLGELGAARRAVAPDLPGFGRSERDVADYSIRAHARYALELLDRLGVERAHVLGYSMGGGVALEMLDLAPERVASVTLVSAIGVQELELFGDARLNRAVHGAQLALLRALPALVPHFGLLSGGMLGVPYARNFYDTDQRPLRGVLERARAPMLIVHGEDDFLVPVEAAREHARVVPQAELELLPTGHFHVFTDPGPAARLVADFLARVDAGRGRTRAQADPERVALAARPFDPAVVPPFAGPALLVVLLVIAFATLASEDLACIGTGLLVADGRLSFAAGTLACFAGIFVGDVLLYVAGRAVGPPALERGPLTWLVRPTALARASAWFRARGGRAVFLSRFLPGTRLPTYVAAGALRQPFLSFALWFVLAGIAWTPALVGFASLVGKEAFAGVGALERWALPSVAVLALLLLALQRLLVPMFSHRGRRLLLGSLLRKARWEFWPPWAAYLPILPWIAWQALRHRSLAVVTAVNPAMPDGGLVGESKAAILAGLPQERVARWTLLDGGDAAERERRARAFLAAGAAGASPFPVVLKPDVGQRGSGVRILRDEASFAAALSALQEPAVLQEFVPGREYGLFWVRRPDEPRGRLFSITEKVLPTVTGDGRRTLERLILDDERAVALAGAYFDANAEHLLEVLAEGETRRLVELGTHCRGAIFLDGERLRTERLERALDEVSLAYEGFCFGRFDVVAPSPEALSRGEFRVIELNGLTSEATHVYDPRHGLVEAYRVLFEQWRLAFEIGAANARRGARHGTAPEILRRALSSRGRGARRRAGPGATAEARPAQEAPGAPLQAGDNPARGR